MSPIVPVAPHLMLRRIASVLRYTQVAALVLAIGIGALIWNTAQRFSATDEWVEHSHGVIAQVGAIRSSTLRAGLWLRNFVIAPNSRALAEVRDSGYVGLDAATELQRLTLDNPAQHARAQRVSADVRQTVGWLDSAATIGEIDGASVVERVIVYRLGKDSARELRLALDDIETHEQKLLTERFSAQASQMSTLKRLCFSGGAAFALFMAWSIAYSSRLMRTGHTTLAELKLDASQDPLTGLMNRRALREAVDRLPTAKPLAVMAFDLDKFKPVNDKYGHAAGDQVLVEVAHRIAAQCRDRDLIARVGGDEFTVVLPYVSDAAHAVVIEDRIRLALREPIVLADGTRVQIGTSIGTAVRGAEMESVDQLLALADMRSYEAKRNSSAAGIRLVATAA